MYVTSEVSGPVGLRTHTLPVPWPRLAAEGTNYALMTAEWPEEWLGRVALRTSEGDPTAGRRLIIDLLDGVVVPGYYRTDVSVASEGDGAHAAYG